MAGRIVDSIAANITGVTAATGSCTVVSSAGFYEGAYAYLRANGQPGLQVKIIDIPDSTHVRVRAVLDPRGGGVSTTSADIKADTNYGATDPTAYNGGVISMPSQLIYNSNDLGLA